MSNLKQTKMNDFFKDYKITSIGWITTGKSKNDIKTTEKKRKIHKRKVDIEPASSKSNDNFEEKTVDSDDEYSFKLMEDIKRRKIELEEYKKRFAEYDKRMKNDEPLVEIKKPRVRSPPPVTQELLDCKSLSDDKLKEYFEELIDYLYDIINEKIHFDRHEIYKNEKIRNRLIMNYSTLVFTSHQTDYLVQIIDKKFEKDIDGIRYLLMILLPEVCLRIFMKVHNMNEEDANKYLKWRPLD